MSLSAAEMAIDDAQLELRMVTEEARFLPLLAIDGDSWPVDPRVAETLERIVAHGSAALSGIRRADAIQLAGFERQSEAR